MKSPIVRTWKISPRMNWPTDATFEASWATFCCASVTCFRIFSPVSSTSNHRFV